MVNKLTKKSEAELLVMTWLKLKTGYGSVLKDKQTALTNKWALLVKQTPLLGTSQ